MGRCRTDRHGYRPPHGRGLKIVVGDKKLANVQAIAKTMNEAGFDVTPVEMDLSSRSSIKALIARGRGTARSRC